MAVGVPTSLLVIRLDRIGLQPLVALWAPFMTFQVELLTFLREL
jgi:hypothetical protein